MTGIDPRIVIRNTRPEDFPGIADVSLANYPDSPPWSERQLASHLSVFPEGQHVAVEEPTGRVVGMASSLIVRWDEYEIHGCWRDFTDNGMFTNHDAESGRTLYGAEVMVHPEFQGRGVGKKIYTARRELVRRLGLLRIRAGARLRNYRRFADRMSAQEYVKRIIRREIADPTLTFQIKQDFWVLAVVPGYLQHDPESLGYAAVIEWLNPEVARPEDFAEREAHFSVSQAAKSGGTD